MEMIDISDLNIEALRQDMLDYFTSAMFIASPLAIFDLTKIEEASDVVLIQIALDNNFNLNNYLNRYTR